MAIREVTVVDWPARCAELEARQSTLGAEGWDEWGQGLWFLGREDGCENAWAHAHEEYLSAGRTDDAVRCGFWLFFVLGHQRHLLKARAWGDRVIGLCDATQPTPLMSTVRALTMGAGAYYGGDAPASIPLFRTARAGADACGEDDLEVIATMALGRSLVETGDAAGFALLDQVMLMIGQGRPSDRAAGPAYCAAIASLLARWDVERARVWTRELDEWCNAQRGLEPFRGECTLHRATILQLGGEWPSAADAATLVRDTERQDPVRADAWYRLAELHRVTGRRDLAEPAYREAAALGREVQPGLALLHRDAGELTVARSGLARALASGAAPAVRADMLATAVSLALEDADPPAARVACAELQGIAATFSTQFLRALAAHASGEVALAGTGEGALAALRAAWSDWQQVGAPYHAALTRIALGRACRAAGDEEGAQLEFDAARRVLEELGALPDLVRLERIAAATGDDTGNDAGLSPRESEVITLIAQGWSNRRIAEHLFLSERTVARHVSNILAKVGVDNRTGATAYAFRHGLAPAS
jgi:DNA-binding CsgD family transcriptional regulator